MSYPRVVNSVFHGSLLETINLNNIYESLCEKDSTSDCIKLYTNRPQMLRIRHHKKGACLLLFKSGCFRIMGNRWSTPGKSLSWLRKFIYSKKPDSMLMPKLQTQTVTFQVNRECVNSVFHKYSKVIFYEPEIFPSAMKLIRWGDVHVNLFFTGKVTVLGNRAVTRALDVQQWLQQIGRPIVLPYIPAMSEFWTCDYDKYITELKNYLPFTYHEMADIYFHIYPRKLIFSWLTEMKRVNGNERKRFISHLCNNIAHFNS